MERWEQASSNGKGGSPPPTLEFSAPVYGELSDGGQLPVVLFAGFRLLGGCRYCKG